MRPTKMLLPLLFGSLLTQQTTAAPNASSATQFKKSSSLHFIENKGQIVDQHHNPRTDIDFKIPASNGLNIFIGAGKIHYQWTKLETTPSSSRPEWRGLTTTQDDERIIMYRMDVTLLNSNPNAQVVTEERQSYYEQYYVTHAGPDGATAHTYRKITYKEVYPNIDWVFRINDQGKLEHDFIVRPGGKVSDIQLQYAGADNLRCSSDGSVTAVTSFGTVTENTPYCFLENGRPVAGKFILENNILGFTTAAYQGTLIIDPVLEWATYFGGTGTYDMAYAVTGDSWGNTYLTGFVSSTDNIATTGSFQEVYGGSNITGTLGDAFLTKFNCDGSSAWATYYGGAAGEQARAVSCDPSGNVYMVGFVNRNGGNPTLNLATPGSHQDTFGGGGGDLFLVKFNGAGHRQWATYYGGSGNEGTTNAQGTASFIPFSVSCDHAGNVYLAGNTNSPDGITTSGSFQQTLSGGYDAFLVQFDSMGHRQWGTYFGGSGEDKGNTVTCDKSGNIYLAGTTASTSGISIPPAHQPATGGGSTDAFLVQFSNTGHPQWATYYGGSDRDEGHSVYCDTSGGVFLAGRTKSGNQIATPGSHQDVYGGGAWDAFLVKFSASGSRLWGTYFGGMHQGAVLGFSCLSTDVSGNIYLAGSAREQDSLSTPGSYQEVHNGSEDGFLVKFDTAGHRQWCTYYGGSGNDIFTGAYADHYGNVFAAGYTASTTNIATSSGHQTTHGGGTNDGMLVRFSEEQIMLRPDTIHGNTVVCNGSTHTYAISPIAGATGYNWILPTGWTGTSTTDSITVTVGAATDTIKVSAEFSCGNSITRDLVVTIIPPAGIISPIQDVFCSGDSTTLVSNTQPGMSWQWLRNGMAIAGATDSMLVVTQSGLYRIITINGQCTDTSEEVTVYPSPVPVITQDGHVLSTDPHYAAYQWYYGTDSVTGATQSGYTYAAEGSYRVKVTDTNGCTGMSQPFTPVGVRGLASDQVVRVYPNPAQSAIQVDAAIPVSVIVSGMDGREVTRTEYTSNIDISSLAEGLYLLQVQDDAGNVVHIEKLVKLAR